MKRLLRNAPLIFAGVYNLYDSTSVLGQGLLRPLYALFAIFLLTAWGIGDRGLPPLSRVMSIAGIALLALLPVFTAQFVRPVSLVGDFVVLIAIAIAIGYGEAIVREPSEYSFGMKVFFGASAVGGLIAPLFRTDIGGRYEPAPIIVVSVLVALSALAQTFRHRFFAAAGIGAYAALGFYSGFRTTLILVFAAVGIALYLRRGAVGLIGGLLAVLLAGSLSGLAGVNPLAPVLDSQAGRLSAIASGEVDASIFIRFKEAEDVIETAHSEWKFGQVLVGSGAGASYVPKRVLIEQNVDEFGRVHNVHIGPIMVYFRHGVVGLLLLSGLALWTFRSLKRLRRRELHDTVESGTAIIVALSITGCLYLIDFLVRNSSVNPGFAISIGVAVAYRRTWSAAPSSGRQERVGQQELVL